MTQALELVAIGIGLTGNAISCSLDGEIATTWGMLSRPTFSEFCGAVSRSSYTGLPSLMAFCARMGKLRRKKVVCDFFHVEEN